MRTIKITALAVLLLTQVFCTSEQPNQGLEPFTRSDFPITVNADCPYINTCDAVETAINSFNEQVGEEVFQVSTFGQERSKIEVVFYIESIDSEDQILAEQTRQEGYVLIEVNEAGRDDYCRVMQQLAFALDMEVSTDPVPNLLSNEPDCDTRDLYPSDDPARSDYFFDVARAQFEELYPEN